MRIGHVLFWQSIISLQSQPWSSLRCGAGKSMNEKLKKVLLWRVLSTLGAWAISYGYLGSATRSLELTAVIGITMTAVHYFFEKWWDNEK